MSIIRKNLLRSLVRIVMVWRGGKRIKARVLACFAVMVGLPLLMICNQASAGTITFPNVGDDSMLKLSFASSIAIPRDRVVGAQVAVVAPNVGIGASGVTCSITETVTVNGVQVPGMPGVYQTNLIGIGVQFYKTGNWAGGWASAPTVMTYTPAGGTGTGSAQNYIRADLVVTGPIQAGTLTSLPSMTVQFTGSCITTLTKTITINPGTAITAIVCTVTTPTVSVPLPAIPVTQLLPIGTVSTASKNFNIGLACSPGASVYITLTDATNPSNTTNNLTLTSGSAHGVALRLDHGGTPVTFGADSAVAGNPGQWLVGASDTTSSVPLTARYVSVGPSIVPGTVNALATFTMSYQ